MKRLILLVLLTLGMATAPSGTLCDGIGCAHLPVVLSHSAPTPTLEPPPTESPTPTPETPPMPNAEEL